MATIALTEKSQRDTELGNLAYKSNGTKFQNSFTKFRLMKLLSQSPETLADLINSKELELHKNKTEKLSQDKKRVELVSLSIF